MSPVGLLLCRVRLMDPRSSALCSLNGVRATSGCVDKPIGLKCKVASVSALWEQTMTISTELVGLLTMTWASGLITQQASIRNLRCGCVRSRGPARGMHVRRKP